MAENRLVSMSTEEIKRSEKLKMTEEKRITQVHLAETLQTRLKLGFDLGRFSSMHDKMPFF